jgi:hypothetical protein
MIGNFLDRGDAIYTGTTLGGTVRLKEKPSYYFKRQCYISADPDERTIAGLMQLGKLCTGRSIAAVCEYGHENQRGGRR